MISQNWRKRNLLRKRNSLDGASDHRILSFETIKRKLFKSLSNGHHTPGSGSLFWKQLIKKLLKTDKDNKYSNEIKSLKYIERVYNDMLEEIKNEKKYYFDNINEDIRKLDEDEVQITNIRKAFKGYAEW